MSAIKKDQERAERAHSGSFMPFRLWQKKGESCEVIILDDDLNDDSFFRHEHVLEDPATKKFTVIEPCLMETGVTCPHCGPKSRPSLVIFLTVQALQTYTDKNGEVHESSRKLLAIKRNQYEEFERLANIARKKYGTFRGTSLILHRRNEDNSHSTGMPVANEDGNMINDHLSEAELIEEFGHAALKNKEGRVYKAENEDTKPFDYFTLFPAPDVEKLKAQEANSLPGSSASNDAEVNGRRRRQRTETPASEEEIEGKEEAEQQLAPSTGRRTRQRVAPGGARPF